MRKEIHSLRETDLREMVQNATGRLSTTVRRVFMSAPKVHANLSLEKSSRNVYYGTVDCTKIVVPAAYSTYTQVWLMLQGEPVRLIPSASVDECVPVLFDRIVMNMNSLATGNVGTISAPIITNVVNSYTLNCLVPGPTAASDFGIAYYNDGALTWTNTNVSTTGATVALAENSKFIYGVDSVPGRLFLVRPNGVYVPIPTQAAFAGAGVSPVARLDLSAHMPLGSSDVKAIGARITARVEELTGLAISGRAIKIDGVTPYNVPNADGIIPGLEYTYLTERTDGSVILRILNNLNQQQYTQTVNIDNGAFKITFPVSILGNKVAFEYVPAAAATVTRTFTNYSNEAISVSVDGADYVVLSQYEGADIPVRVDGSSQLMVLGNDAAYRLVKYTFNDTPESNHYIDTGYTFTLGAPPSGYYHIQTA